MNKVCILLLCFLFPLRLMAQFNDSVHHQINYTSAGSINRTNDATAYLLNNSLKYGVRKDDFRFNSTSSWIYGEQNRKVTNNDFTSTLDFNLYKTFKHFYYWGLGNYVTSYSLKIDNQVQAGLGAAYNIVDQKDLVVNISDGFLYERSDIFLSDTVLDKYHTFRNSFRLQFRCKIKDLVTLNGIGFVQNSVNDGNDYIVKANVSATIRLYKWVNFTTAYTYNKVSRTRRENMLFTYGLTFERFF